MSKNELNALIKAILRLRVIADDEEAIDNILAFPKWEVGKAYEKDERIRYQEVLYKALQAHTSQSTWTPDVTPSLYVRVTIEEWPEWVQPVGSTDAYPLNSKVSHNSKHWISTVDSNVWEPGVYGWEEVE